MKWNKDDNIMTIVLEEDLIAPKVMEYKEKVMEYLEDADDVDDVLIDLARTENIDSVGVTFIISLYKTALRDGKGFRVTGSSEDIKQLFRLMKLDEFFDLDE